MPRCTVRGEGGKVPRKKKKNGGGKKGWVKPVMCQAPLLYTAMEECGGDTVVWVECWALGSPKGELKDSYELCNCGLPNVKYSASLGCFSLCLGVCRIRTCPSRPCATYCHCPGPSLYLPFLACSLGMNLAFPPQCPFGSLAGCITFLRL